MDDERGESMEATGEVRRTVENQSWRDQRVVDGEKPGVDSRDEGKHTGRNDRREDDVDNVDVFEYVPDDFLKDRRCGFHCVCRKLKSSCRPTRHVMLHVVYCLVSEDQFSESRIL